MLLRNSIILAFVQIIGLMVLVEFGIVKMVKVVVDDITLIVIVYASLINYIGLFIISLIDKYYEKEKKQIDKIDDDFDRLESKIKQETK